MPVSSGPRAYRGLLLPLCPPLMLPVPEDGESRLTCRARGPWGLPRAEGALPESGVPGELALLLLLLEPNNLEPAAMVSETGTRCTWHFYKRSEYSSHLLTGEREQAHGHAGPLL